MATNNVKKTPKKRDQCGTVAGYRAHYRAGEAYCEPCRAANIAYQRQRRERVKNGEPTAKPTKKSKRDEAEAVGAAIVEVDSPTPPDLPGQPYPPYLKAAGRKLWDEVTTGYNLNPAALQVLTHACRMTDQLERFTAALSSKSTLWFELDIEEGDDAGTPVIVNGMIGEGRQLSNAVRTALSQIGVLKTDAGGSGTSIQDQIKAKREQRLAKAKNEGGAA